MNETERGFWLEGQRRISREISRQNYETWIKPVRMLSIEGEGVELGVPNRFFKEWLLDHYYEVLTRTLREVLEKDDISLSFRVQKEEATSGWAGTSPEPRPKPAAAAQKVPNLNPKYTFASFVVGSSNQFAHAAALAVAENPAKAYNPLFVYGGVGLGKTHLLNAVCSYVRERSPKTKVKLLTSEQFTNELISSIHYNRMNEFRNKYRSTDVLVIDDIQFIAGKERTQEEFFHTFNALYEDSRQLVLSSDRIPRDMPDMEERLRSRFEWGLIADIQAPDLETKVAIVEKKARIEGIEIPKDVAMFVATNVKSNVRELEGALIRLGAYASLTGQEVDIDLAKNVLRDIIAGSDKVLSLEDIIKKVADHDHVRVSEMKSKRRTRKLVRPRQLAMYLCRTLAGASLSEVGRVFGGKDHTTVLHACRQVEDHRLVDIKFDAEVESLAKSLKE